MVGSDGSQLFAAAEHAHLGRGGALRLALIARDGLAAVGALPRGGHLLTIVARGMVVIPGIGAFGRRIGGG